MLQAETSLGEQIGASGKSTVAGFVSFFLSQFLTARETPSAVVRKHEKPRGHQRYSWAQIAQHSTPDDCWIVVEDKVFDVSGWSHPGGDVIFSQGGRDATELFNVMHKNQAVARANMKQHLIGEVSQPNQTALLKDWNAMREQFSKKGLMDASGLYYVRKGVELVSMLAACVYINCAYPTSLPMVLLSAFILGIFMFQCGWTQHDFQHNQVFRSHKMNAFVGNITIGLGIGGSAHWWKNKHNQHHATPNKMDADSSTAIDPDIDTIPLFAWNEALMKQVNPADRGFIVLQHLLLWPLLFIALVNWQAQSIIHLMQAANVPKSSRRNEMALIIVHHAWTLALSFLPLGLYKGLIFWAVSHAVGGFVISFVFVQSHNAMEIYTDHKDFVSSQMVSTRNINPGLVTDWVFGGLNYQIEHHLFPTMPRHSFSRIRNDVMQFCVRHGLPYESISTWESTGKVYAQLRHVAKAA